MSNEDFNAAPSPSPDISDGLPGAEGGSGDVTETSSKSWFERILDSLKAILFGLVLVIGSGALMFWNEGRSAKTAAALSEGAGLTISLPAEKVDPAQEGRLIHVAGATTSVQPVRDPDLGIESKALILARKVEMFQWKEDKHTETQKKLGGGEETITRYSYSREWSDKPIDSGKFRNSADHRNPAMPALASRSFYAPDAKLGAFALNEGVMHLLNASETFEAPAGALAQARARLGPRAQVLQGSIYAGVNPDQPAIGDVRVAFHYLPLTPVSVVGRQTQATFSPWTAGNGREILLAETGVLDAAVMFKHGQDENRILTWILRAVGVLLMWIGFRVALSLLEVLADVVPFIGNIVGAGASLAAFLFTLILAPVIIAAAWFFYRPFVAAGVIAAGALLVYGLRTLMHKRVAARGSQPGLQPLPAGAPASFLSGAPLARKLPGGPER